MNTPNGYKFHYISQLVVSAAAALFLLQAIIKNPYPLTRLIMGAVFLLVLVNVAKTLFMVLDKPQAAAICNKIYVVIFALYWFGFLGFFCYTITQSGNYISIIFTVPFWIAGIGLIYQVFIKKIIQHHKEEKTGYNGVTYEEAPYGETVYTETEYHDTAYDESEYSETAYTETGYEEPEYRESEYHESEYHEPEFHVSGNGELRYGKTHRAAQSRAQAIGGGILVGICLVAGILMLFFGIRGTIRLNKTMKEYESVDGYFSNYDVYSVDEEDGTTYRLIYTYTVDGTVYEVATDYGSGSIPAWGSIREVKYNPNNPAEAILKGTNGTNILIYLGAFFVMVSMTFVLTACMQKGLFARCKVDVLGLYIGIIFTVIGVGVVLIQYSTTGSFAGIIKSMHFWILIPIVFIVFGVWQTIRCLLPKREEEY